MKLRGAAILTLAALMFPPAVKYLGAATSEFSRSLTPEIAEKLKSLPYGISEQKSLFIRFKHVESVQFFGAGHNSRYTFKRGSSIMPEGLSLSLTTTQKDNWANGTVQFKKPMDVSKYNSMVVWAQASQPEMRIWLGMRDTTGQSNTTPARTDVLPIQGFPVNEPVQLVIPLSRFFSKPKINTEEISQITFEFGQETVGNSNRGTIQIFGFAFVEQSQNLKRAQVVLNRAKPKVVMGESTRVLVPEDQPVEAPKPVARRPRVLSALGQKVKALIKMTDVESLNFFKQMGLDLRPRRNDAVDGEDNRPIIIPQSYAREWISPYARVWPALPSNQTDVSAVIAITSTEGGSDMWYFLAVGVLAVLWFLIRRRGNWSVSSSSSARLGKVMHEIHWPFLSAEPSDNRRVERDFWRGVAAQQARFGWISTAGLSLENGTNNEYFGESFLRRQVRQAARAGLRVFPSISFTDTVFRKGAFQSNPQRAASALRTLVTDTLFRFADVATGVRVENTALLLNVKLRRPAGRAHKFYDNSDEWEFWADVISAVKTKHPGFLFIADAAGDQAELLSDVGFDHFENDRLMQSMITQIRAGNIGDLTTRLMHTPDEQLRRSIFNVTPLVKPFPKKQSEQHQNFMAAVLVSLLPGMIQHDDSLPDDLTSFIDRVSHFAVLKKGSFSALETSSPNIFAFARWQKKSLILAVANFSTVMTEASVNLEPLHQGFENNKLYLFNNPLHGTSALKNLLNQPDTSGPAMALWGQNLRDTGLPLMIPGLSLSLFSVSLSRPITTTPQVSTANAGAVPALT